MTTLSFNEVGAVYLPSAPDRILQALAAGKHVLCQPPPAETIAECEQLLALAAQSGLFLMVENELRFRPEYGYLQFLAEDRPFGRILTATLTRHSGRPSPDATNSLLHFLLGEIDLLLALFGTPTQVNCKAFAGPESAMACLIYPGGPEVRLQGGWLPVAAPMSEGFQVRAERAELTFSREGLLLNDTTGLRQPVALPPVNAHAEMQTYFHDCCRDHLPPLRCPPSASALAIRVALLLKQSRDLGGQPLECKV